MSRTFRDIEMVVSDNPHTLDSPESNSSKPAATYYEIALEGSGARYALFGTVLPIDR